jgi:hypothetical protein
VNILLTHLRLDYPGGSETYTYTVARALLERSHRPTVVPGDGGTPAGRDPVARMVLRAGLLRQEDASP